MIKENEALRYGTYLIDKEFNTSIETRRVRIISYEQNIYWHEMLNGVVVDFKKIGIVE